MIECVVCKDIVPQTKSNQRCCLSPECKDKMLKASQKRYHEKNKVRRGIRNKKWKKNNIERVRKNERNRWLVNKAKFREQGAISRMFPGVNKTDKRKIRCAMIRVNKRPDLFPLFIVKRIKDGETVLAYEKILRAINKKDRK